MAGLNTVLSGIGRVLIRALSHPNTQAAVRAALRVAASELLRHAVHHIGKGLKSRGIHI